jgi:homoserine kinase type II
MPSASDHDSGSPIAAWLGSAAWATAPLRTGGFSGASVHEVRIDTDRYVLKAFAAGTAPARAGWIHGLARHLRAAGIAEAPEVMATPDGRTAVADRGGRLWELVRFVAGTATATPTAGQAAAALDALGRLHAAAATVGGEPVTRAPSPGLGHRIERARRLRADSWRSRQARLGPWSGGGALAAALRERLEAAVSVFASADGDRAVDRLTALAPPPLPLQPVLRDVWAEHVLFAADMPTRVAGFIDFHAAGVDTPATDIARLLGTWRRHGSAGGFLEAWAAALAAYESHRPLAPFERWAVPVLHAAGVVFGLDNWFRWVLEEGRTFSDPTAALLRADRLLAALPVALQELATIGTVSETGAI